MGYAPGVMTEEQIEAKFKEYDFSGDGVLNFDEFDTMMTFEELKETCNDLTEAIDEATAALEECIKPPNKEIFDSMDTSGDGTVTLCEAKAAYKKYAPGVMTDEQIEAKFKEFDF